MIWQLSILFAFAPLALSCTGAGTIDLDSSMTQFTLQSDNYPNPYPNSNDCEWVFTSPADTLVTLSCPEVNIYGNCRRNRFAYIIEGVEVRNCSGSIDVASSNNAMKVTFQTRKNRRSSTGFVCAVSYTSQGLPTTSQPTTPQPTTPQPTTPQPTTPQPTTPQPTTPQPPVNVACSCGKRNPGTSRIVGGLETSPHEYPWQAILYRNLGFICGGSLISNEWVLTAAHCIDAGTAAEYLVLLGNHNRSIIDEGQVQFSVSEIIVHENYDSDRLYNDIGLLRLASKAVYSSTISPVCLPFRYESDPTIFDGDNTTVTGWGRLGTSDSSSRVLMKVELMVLSYSQCRARYSGVTTDMICATDTGRGVCFGDSGGPLVYQDSAIDFLAGVVSYVVGGCANPNYFSGFTRVTSFLTWLGENTGESFEVCYVNLIIGNMIYENNKY